MNKNVSVIIPTRNAASVLPATLAAIRAEAPDVPVIVIDGESADATVVLASAGGARVMATSPVRGRQLAAGIAAATTPWVLLLHADTRLGAGWHAEVAHFMAMPANVGRAGYFRFALASEDPRARRLERLVAWRCRRLGLPYGDQGLLVARATLSAIGGMRWLPLMEDVDLVRRLDRRRLVALECPAITSAVRWQEGGWTWRSVRNLACLGLWYAGVPPRLLARLYG